MYNIEIYEDKNGKSEIRDYIKSIQRRKNKNNNIKFTKIVAYIRILSESGLSIGEPYIKHIDSNIWELRPLRDRILFAYCNNNRFILLSVFMKKSQKTPQKEIDKAKRLLKDYIKRSVDKNG